MTTFALAVGAWLAASLLCLVIVALVHAFDRLDEVERKGTGCAVPAGQSCLMCELDNGVHEGLYPAVRGAL